MKKLIFGGFAVLLAFALITCDGETPNVINNGGLIDVEYSKDGKSVTIYLDGGVSRTTASRALTADMARSGHDYFEVVFYDGTNVARASWEIGESVGVRNVPRGAAGTGIDYATVGSTAAGALTAPTSGNGYAALFVGRKADRTLLAVGKLTSADGGGAATVIDETTTAVTFTVAALVAGVNTTAANSSFLTAALDLTPPNYDTASAPNTEVANRAVGSVNFPMFGLPNVTASIAASYSIGVVTGATASEYLPAIRIADPTKAIPTATVPTKRVPRYPVGNIYNYVSGNSYDVTTTVALGAGVTGATVGFNFINPIPFTFGTTLNADPRVFSFYFEIPVFAITNSTASLGANVPSLTWFVRSGYGPSLYDIDDGKGGPGGCVLVGFRASELGIITVSTIEP